MTDQKTIVGPDDTPFGKVHGKRQTERKVRCISVPEWGEDEKPLLLYAYPLTVAQVMLLEGKYQNITEQNIMQIIVQCLDATGENYFSLLDKPALQNEPSELIGDILVQLNGTLSSFTEELKKNRD